ncbi:MAG: hypothetical protein C0601_09740 [Candidatus Muiribacterium halophilum]|uniref:Uncharacterized protein n=1 Tax=Muiribacterium halophilum TaxID=2053465 RepID=A0A2N5ZDL7_MUIH1|nr:MAG: hypothetical protein C0601_09740 [Candidatus Muirbacterium halophilum]
MIENIMKVKNRIKDIKSDINNIHKIKTEDFKKELEKTKETKKTKEVEKESVETKLKKMVDDNQLDSILDNSSIKDMKRGEIINKNKLDFYKMISEKLF